MINRIELILKTQNLSPTKFADAVGIQRPTMSHILARRNNPSLDFVTKVLNRFPEINPEWLLTGKGQMLKLGASLPSGTSPQMPQMEVKSPEFEWDNERDIPKIVAAPQIVSEQPQNLPPYSQEITVEHEKISPETKRDLNQPSDIERIIVFFTDGTFRSYVA